MQKHKEKRKNPQIPNKRFHVVYSIPLIIAVLTMLMHHVVSADRILVEPHQSFAYALIYFFFDLETQVQIAVFWLLVWLVILILRASRKQIIIGLTVTVSVVIGVMLLLDYPSMSFITNRDMISVSDKSFYLEEIGIPPEKPGYYAILDFLVVFECNSIATICEPVYIFSLSNNHDIVWPYDVKFELGIEEDQLLIVGKSDENEEDQVTFVALENLSE